MENKKFKISSVIVYFFLIAWGLTTVYPIIWVIQNSFKVRNEILQNSFALPIGELFTMSNYKKAFDELNILGAYVNSLTISGIVAAVVILLAGLASFALVRYEFKFNKVLQSLVLAGMMFPAFATIITVIQMQSSWGIANTDKWFLTMLSVILPSIAGNLSFAIVVLSGYIRGLPIELEESAFLEGCNPFQIFFKVIVPLTKPSFATVAIFSFLWSYNDLFTQSFFLRRPNMFGITILLNRLTSNEGTNYGLMASAVTLVVVPVIIVYICLQKYIIKGLTAGAIKG